MAKGNIALVCGVSAFILGSLVLVIGVGGLASLVLVLIVFVLALVAAPIGAHASKNKGAPGYKACTIGGWMGMIGCLEVVAAGLIHYL